MPALDDSLLPQGFADGVEYCPQVYRSPVDGTVKTLLREGRVGNADAVIRIDRGDAPDIADLAETAVAALDLSGPIDMDIRRDADGTPQVLEINARFGANSAHAPELLSRLLDDAAQLPSVAALPVTAKAG